MRILFPLVVAAFVFSCGDEPTGAPVEPAEPAAVEEGSVRATVLVSRAGGSVIAIRIAIEAQPLVLGAYQGRFTYDPAAMELLDASMPKDGYRVMNTHAAGEGLIRFAGFTVEQFESPVVLTLEFQVHELTAVDKVHVGLDAVGSVEGIAVPEDRILDPTVEWVIQ